MRKIYTILYTGYCGEDQAELLEYEDDVTDRDIDEDVQALAYQHAEIFGRGSEEDECGIEGFWEDYVPEKHDNLV